MLLNRRRQSGKADVPAEQGAAVTEPWFCLDCGATNKDGEAKQCHACKVFRKKEEEEAAGEVDKSALSPATVKIIEETNPDKLEEEAEMDEGELEYWEGVVKQCAKWSDRSPVSRGSEDQAKKRIAELKEKGRRQ